MSRYTLGFSRDIYLPYEQALDALVDAMRQEGFAIIGRTDVYDSSSRDGHCTVLDLYDRSLLARLLALRPDLSLAAACRAVVKGREKGSTLCITDPYQALAPAMHQVDGKEKEIVEELNRRLWSAYLRVVLAAEMESQMVTTQDTGSHRR